LEVWGDLKSIDNNEGYNVYKLMGGWGAFNNVNSGSPKRLV